MFRHTVAPYDDDFKAAGGGVSFNVRVNPTRTTKIFGQGAVGSGLGRYIGGLVPDAAFRSDGSISLIDTTSWVAGVEQSVTDRVSVAGYYSGVNTDGNYSTDRDGSAIGFGYPGSSSSNNRTIREVDGDRRLSDRQDTRSRFGTVQHAGVVADQGAVVDATERVVVGAIVHVSRAGSLQPAVAQADPASIGREDYKWVARASSWGACSGCPSSKPLTT